MQVSNSFLVLFFKKELLLLQLYIGSVDQDQFLMRRARANFTAPGAYSWKVGKPRPSTKSGDEE
jgi:hypothetical protein